MIVARVLASLIAVETLGAAIGVTILASDVHLTLLTLKVMPFHILSIGFMATLLILGPFATVRLWRCDSRGRMVAQALFSLGLSYYVVGLVAFGAGWLTVMSNSPAFADPILALLNAAALGLTFLPSVRATCI